MARYLGIDYGVKRIGLALSDPLGIIAQPFRTVKVQSQKKLLADLKQIIFEYEITRIILGMPLTMKGTDSQMTKEVRRFAEILKNDLAMPVQLVDERLTSTQAHSTLHQLGKKTGKYKEKIDQLAAQTILQTYLDREKRGKL